MDKTTLQQALAFIGTETTKIATAITQGLKGIADKEVVEQAKITSISQSLQAIAEKDEVINVHVPDTQRVQIEGLETLTPLQTIVNIDMTATNELLRMIAEKKEEPLEVTVKIL